MIQQIYSVFDEKAQSFHSPFFTTTDGVAVRMMRQTLQDRQTSLAQFPSDFILYRLGEFDVASGLIAPVQPEQVIRLSALLEEMSDG